MTNANSNQGPGTSNSNNTNKGNLMTGQNKGGNDNTSGQMSSLLQNI